MLMSGVLLFGGSIAVASCVRYSSTAPSGPGTFGLPFRRIDRVNRPPCDRCPVELTGLPMNWSIWTLLRSLVGRSALPPPPPPPPARPGAAAARPAPAEDGWRLC
jgi:hypothetical protein